MFPGPTLQAAITQVIEQALNRTLQLDPAGRDLLLAALARPVAFRIETTGMVLSLQQVKDRVQGDVGSAHALQRAMADLNPDWEAALAGHIGDIPAHFIGQRVRGALGWQRQAFRSLSASVEEYIHEESGSLPGRNELSATFEDIDQLNLQSDRLAARIQYLEHRLKAASEPTEPS